MAASGSTPSASLTTTTTTVPVDFHYETKYIVLSYLGMLPVKSRGQATEQGDSESDRERNLLIKAEIKEALRQLESEITSSFSTTGFDSDSSLVFNPANPESSVEDCLATVGDRVAKELDARLAEAVGALLEGTLDYQRFRDATLGLSTHAQEGWSKVLVPLVLLQALNSEGQSLTTLVQLGMRFLEENEADFILQQGGWSEVFSLQPHDDQVVTIAEDSNDIYILSGDQHPDQLSPPSSLLCTGDNSSEQSSWQTESLPVSLAGHESWAQVGGMDPEDVKSLDSTEGGALAEERSENNSSNSDIVHVEREEAELLEEGGEVGAIDESMMSVLGTESELAELREEFREQTPPVPEAADADTTEPASLLSLEEPVVIEAPVSLSAEPSLVSLEPELLPPPVPDVAETPAFEPEPAGPPSAPAVQPDPEPEAESEPEPEPAATSVPDPAEVAPPSLAIEAPEAPAELEPTSEPAPEPVSVPEPEVEPISVPPQAEPETVAEPEVLQVLPAVTEAPVEVPTEEPPVPEFQMLLYGGATLAALAAVIVYSVVSYRRK